MPAIQSWQPVASNLPLLQCLKEGGCIALPTESTYELVASGLHPDAVGRLASFVRDDNVPTIVLGDDAELRDWMPLATGVGPRLYRKLGPAPLILRGRAGFTYGLWARLPAAVQSLVVCDGQLALRWPAHPLWADLRALDFPLVSLALPGARTAQDAAQQLGESVQHVADGGPTEFATLPSIVQVDGQNYVLQREGALSGDKIRELALCHILFICTGNTCRSPMAEALCTKLLADRLGCPPQDLKQQGFCVQSAGIAAMMGKEASPEAVVVVAQEGASLSAHRSRTATIEMLTWADHVFAMTYSHWHALKTVSIASIREPRLLSPLAEDVADPIGGEMADYQACANQILACLKQRLPELLES